MLLSNKTADEIETFGGSQEAWGNPFLFDLKTKCRQNKRFFNDLNIPLCTLYASSLGMLQDLLWRWFLGFSVSPSGIWSLGDAEDSGEDRSLQGGCAQLPQGVFGSLSLWKSGIPDVDNADLTINNGVISPIIQKHEISTHGHHVRCQLMSFADSQG